MFNLPTADTLDANKKGEKSKSSVEEVEKSSEMEPTSIIQNMPTSEGESTAIPEESIVVRLAVNPQIFQVPIPTINTSIKQVLIPDFVLPKSIAKVEPSYLSEFKPMLSSDKSPVKRHSKNTMRTDFSMPKPDELKPMSK